MSVTPHRPGAEALREEAEALAQGLPPLLVSAERLAASVSMGVHGRRKPGIGESFWQFRRYQPEDAAGTIDWRQSARSQHLYVRQREWEAAEAVWFWADSSPGMRFRSAWAEESKARRASVLLLALASLLVRGGEKIALLGDGQGPSSGKPALRRFAESLAQDRPDELPPDAPVTRNAQFVWISDFLAPMEAIDGALKRLIHAGLGGQLLHIADPAEAEFPYSGRTRFETPAGIDSELIGRAEMSRDAYRARFRAHSEALRALAKRQGWSYIAHRTDAPADTALIAAYANLGGDRLSLRGA